MAQASTLRCTGLYTFPNNLSELPTGALTTADNVVIDREGTISPRRGFPLYGDQMTGSATLRPKQLLVYKNRIIRHYSTRLEYDSTGTGTFAAFDDETAATASVTEVETGTRIKGIEANSNFYLTTSTGIKKISAADASGLATAQLVDAGGLKALDGQASINENTAGFFTQDSTVAYRILWGIKDANNNFIYGTPSERIVVTNELLYLLLGDYNTLCDSLASAAATDITTTGDTTNTSTSITNIPNTANLVAGMGVSGSGIPASTTIISVDSSTAITISAAATATAAGVALTFSDKLDNTDYASLKLSTSSAASTLHTALKTLCERLDADLGVTTYYNSGAAPSIYNDHSTAPNDPATTTELEDLQAFYDAIVNALIVESAVNICDAAQLAGNFQNSRQSCTVSITFTVPDKATTSHFYQIYRTALSTSTGASYLSDLDPGDEMGLVYEGNPSSAEITAKAITVEDITPESFRGANLYTNANSGEGIAQANEVPPLAKDIAVFKNSVFYANTQTKHRKSISLLSATNLTNRTLTIGVVGGGTHVYTFRDTVKTTEFTVVAGSLLSKSPSASDYFDIRSAGDETVYRVWFNVDSANAAPSSTGVNQLVEVSVLSTDSASVVATALTTALNTLDAFEATSASNVVTAVNVGTGTATDPTLSVADVGFTFTVPAGKTGAGEDAAGLYVGISNAATPAQAVDETARSLVRIINKQTTEAVIAQYISGPSDVPGAITLESEELGSAAFYLTVSDTTAGAKFNPTLPTTGQTEKSDNEVAPNRIYYSKVQQPEAVPIVNYLDVGAKDKKILRVMPLRDSLFVLKEDGVYRISGDAGSFGATLFDSSTTCKAGDTAAVLNNQIYMFADQGIVTVSDTGISVISRPIENLLLPLTTSQYTNFTSASFAVGYESDRAFILWTVEDTTDTTATQAFRYNTFTSTWTRWTLGATCAVVNAPIVDKLYVGCNDTNYIACERKDFARTDHADRETALTLPSLNGIDGAVLSLGGTFSVEEGDAIVQTQYLTIGQFNRFLKKLDNDNGVADTDYYTTLAAVAGDDLSTKLTALVAKLNADTGVADSDYTSSGSIDFATVQADFNTIVDKLNLDSGVAQTTFRTSTGTTEFERTVVDVDDRALTITLNVSVPFIAGAMTSYRKIGTEVTWAPQHFGDPSTTKQVREATIMFENNSFTSAEAGFASDLSTGNKFVPFEGEGTGIFGGSYWGLTTWGWEGTQRPFRTLVPRDKQRCRFITTTFKHSVAFEKYAIFGISYTFEPISSRGYR